MARKVIVLGFDGATFDVIDPLIAEGRCPCLQRITAEGAVGELASVIPANSAPAWSSFSTGMNPGKHGVYYFTERVPGSYKSRFTHSVTRTGKPLWMTVSDSGRRVAVINVPGTFPPDVVDGFMISGLDTPSTTCSFTWPKDLYDQLKRQVGDYAIEPEEARMVQLRNDDDRRRFVKAIRGNIQLRWRCVKYLIDKAPPDLSIIVFTATDRIQHRLWKFMDPKHPHHNEKESTEFKDAIPSVYADLDDIVSEVMGQMDDETTLFIMSDHGLGLRSDKTIYVNRWLLAKGYLNLLGTRDTSGKLKAAVGRKLQQALNGIRRRMSLRQRHLLRLFFHRIMREGALLLETMNIDWHRTRAYSNELMNAIWLNVEGREPLGTVKPGSEYETLRDEIAASLVAIKDPETGESVVERIHTRDEIYHGSEFHKAPDLVVEWNDYTTQASSLAGPHEAEQYLSKLTPEQTSRAAMSQTSGEHKAAGILFAYGCGIKQAARIENASIIDMAPTILFAMDEHIPDDMDGRVLTELFTDEYLAEHKVQFSNAKDQADYKARQADVSPADEQKLKEQLESLGYL